MSLVLRKDAAILLQVWRKDAGRFVPRALLMDLEPGTMDSVRISALLSTPQLQKQVMVSDDEKDALSTNPDELIDSDDSEGISGDEEDIFRSLLARVGFHLTYGDNPTLLLDPSQPQVTLREKLLMDVGAILAFLTGLQVYLDDPAKVKQLFLPKKVSSASGGSKSGSKGENSSPSLMKLLMGVKVLQQAIIDLILDIMVECCQSSEGKKKNDSSDQGSKDILDANGNSICRTNMELQGTTGKTSIAQNPIGQRLDVSLDGALQMQAVQSSDSLESLLAGKAVVPPTSLVREEDLQYPSPVNNANQLLKRSPKHLQPDLISLVPKLVDASEHSLAAYALLTQLHKTDTKPALWLPSTLLKHLKRRQWKTDHKHHQKTDILSSEH